MASLAYLSPLTFVGAPPPQASSHGGTASDNALLRAWEREQHHAPTPLATSPHPTTTSDSELFCADCLARCEGGGWDVIAGPHTGHTCLPLRAALEVLPAALPRQVHAALAAWDETVVKPHRAQTQALDESMEHLLQLQRAGRERLARLLVELAENDRRLHSVARAKAVAACNWRYQRDRMAAQVGLWRSGCGRLQVELRTLSEEEEEEARQKPSFGTGTAGSMSEGWAHGRHTAARELARLATTLDVYAAEWAREVAEAQHEAAAAVAAAETSEARPEAEGRRAQVDRGNMDDRASEARAASSPSLLPVDEGFQMPFSCGHSDRNGGGGGGCDGGPSDYPDTATTVPPLCRCAPHRTTAPAAPSPVSAQLQPHSVWRASRHRNHVCVSGDEFALARMAAAARAVTAAPHESTDGSLPFRLPAATDATSDPERAQRAERQRRLQASERVLQAALEAILTGTATAGTTSAPGAESYLAIDRSTGRGSPPEPPTLLPASHAAVPEFEECSRSSSLESLQRQLLEELQRLHAM